MSNESGTALQPDVLTFDRFVVGGSFGPSTETPDPALIAAWRRLYPGDQFPDGCFPRAMATVLMMRAYMQLLAPRPPGNIHAGQKMVLGDPVRIGDAVTTTIVCTDKAMRRERRYVTVRATGVNQEGRMCFEGDLTLIWAA